MRRPPLLAIAALAAASFAGGCHVKKPAPATQPYYGATDDLPTLVDKLNARSERLVSLRAEGSFSAEFVDPKTGKRDSPPSGDVTLLFTPPQNLRLRATFLTNLIFDLGSNDTEYWLLQQDTVMYTGTHAAAAEGRARQLPIQPEALIEVLGVTPMPTDLLRQPAPVLRFNNDADCYMLTWHIRLRDRWAVQKEVWYDRQSLQPTRVMLYDPNGRAVLKATPGEPKPVAGYDPPLSMPSQYDLLFPETGSTFGLQLRVLEKNRKNVPNPKNFVMPIPPSRTQRESLDR